MTSVRHSMEGRCNQVQSVGYRSLCGTQSLDTQRNDRIDLQGAPRRNITRDERQHSESGADDQECHWIRRRDTPQESSHCSCDCDCRCNPDSKADADEQLL
jgi:hypothetical protein